MLRAMEGRTMKCSQASPERSKVWTEAPPKQHHQHQLQQQQGRKIPVVYYLCRNRHLEHPHFIEVPTSSPEGLYLRDVISRLNVLRGKGMVAMYSWSCKRNYKNGFVWHDLSEDDLILPAQGNEYVLKGSELMDTSPSDRLHHAAWSQTSSKHLLQEIPAPSRSQEASPSFSEVVIKEVKPPPPQPTQPSPSPLLLPAPEEDLSPTLHRPSSSRNIFPEPHLNPPWGGGGSSPGLSEWRVYKANGATDASTQTEDRGSLTRNAAAAATAPATRSRVVSTDDGALDLELRRTPRSKESFEISGDEISPPPTSSSASFSGGKTETLESLIRADAQKMNSFRILEEEEVLAPAAGAKLKATNVLMQLVTCGSISVKDHHSFGLLPTYKSRFSHVVRFPSPLFWSSRGVMGELECPSEHPRMVVLRREEKEFFSGSLIETKKHKKGEGELVVPTLERSSSYSADRSCKPPDSTGEKVKAVDAARSKCLPRTIKITSNKQSKSENMRSPISDGPRISSSGADCSQPTHLCSSKGSSKTFTDASSKGSSMMGLESFREDKEKAIKIEERLTSGAWVIIHSTAACDDSEDSSSS